MKLIIYDKDEYNKKFIYYYLKEFILKTFNDTYDRKRLDVIDKEFNIDSLDIITNSLKTLNIIEQPNAYIIEINKNKKLKQFNIDSLINLITYGNRSCKGYPLVYEIFKYVIENIDNIYEEWKVKYGD